MIKINIINSLASWKAKLLCMMGRIQLVNSMIFGLSYSFQVYKWSIKFLFKVEQWIKNFIWTGNTQKWGLLIVKGLS